MGEWLAVLVAVLVVWALVWVADRVAVLARWVREVEQGLAEVERGLREVRASIEEMGEEAEAREMREAVRRLDPPPDIYRGWSNPL